MILKKTQEEILENNNIKIKVVEKKDDIYSDIADLMAKTLKENNDKGRPTSFILPVGPRGQYRLFAEICNRQKISCRDLVTINMDEYLDSDHEYISISSPFSFRAFMEKNLFSLLDKRLGLNKENVYFPDPKRTSDLTDVVDELGGVDICFGGVGINGHIAFNEPILDGSIDREGFLGLKTRALDLSRDTIVINSLKYGGSLELVPKKAITIGMYEIFRSKSLRFYMEHDWQSAVLRKAVFLESGPRFPVAYLKEHNDPLIVVSRNVLESYTT
jgi:glucosamine-6-phosphate deaminase